MSETIVTAPGAKVHFGFQNSVLSRIDSALEALESLSLLAEELRHSDVKKISDNAYNALQDARMQGQRYIGPSFVCERCKHGFRGDGRFYPGSHVANQPKMDRVCDPCERILIDVAARALAAAPPCQSCGRGKATFPETGLCWPCHDKAERAKSAPAAAALPVAVATVIISPLAYEMLARADKARLMAKILVRGGIPATDAARMTAEDWKQFHAGLKAKGIVGPYSTVPSAHTVAMVLVGMRKRERATPLPLAVHVHRRAA